MVLSSLNSVCYDIVELWYFIGLIIMILKFSFPIIIIVFGMLDLGRAIVSTENDDIKKALKKILKRIIVSVIIFFIPSVVLLVFDLFNEYTRNANSFNLCRECLLSPTKYECKQARSG